jgi:dipeptidyl aminopeptidase/acylaminoacyl peptidase
MNLWRVPIEERSGLVLGTPEPVTTPSPYSGYLSFSRDGALLAYSDSISSNRTQMVGFDAVNGKIVGQPLAVPGPAIAYDLSPSEDGKWLAFVSGRNQDDIFVIRTDGTELRQLTDDSYRDMGPRWSPDGKLILFYSNQSGRYQVCTINADGSSRRQLTEAADEMWYSMWSPDGRRLAGRELMADGRIQGVLVYSFDDRHFDKLTGSGAFAVWLRDSRRLVFSAGDKLNLIDSQSREIKEILSVAPHFNRFLSISADNRTIYFNVVQEEGDIWLASLK